MSTPWSAPRSRPLFGYMHEDASVERSLLLRGGRALCVLSAGDMAFELLRAGASCVVAADPNPAQHELVRMKLVNAARGERCHMAGLIDLRLRWVARWIAPFVFPKKIQGADAEVLARYFTTRRWGSAWWLLRFGIAMVFHRAFRRHIPRDVVARLRQRFEAACIAQSGNQSPWLKRMLCHDPGEIPDAWDGTWPDAEMQMDDRMIFSMGLLHETGAHFQFDLVAASNILDTEPAPALLPLLDALAPQVREGGWLVMRSLFRDTREWPMPDRHWVFDEKTTSRIMLLDRSPLCRVSLVLRRASNS